MRIPGRAALLSSVCAAALAIASCASAPATLPPNLSAAEIFQRAQDASDRGDYKLAMRYYSTVRSSHPDDISHITWASYEIAFLYHKMGNNAMALSLINELLDKYTGGGDTLPPGPHVLAAKLKPRLEAMLKKPQPAQTTQSTPASSTPAVPNPAAPTPPPTQ